MQIESLALNKIIPYIRNPRKNENAVEKVASSIKEFGFRQPIVVDAENVIIAGHTRFEAAKRLGLDLVPVHIAAGLTDDGRINAYQFATHVDQCAARVAWIDRGICLNEIFVAVALYAVATQRADDARCDGVL